MTPVADPSKAAAPAEGRPPAILQIVPRLVSGGVERGTIEIAAALAAAGWRSYVASAGGKMVQELQRHGSTHVTLPLAAKNPLVLLRNVGRLARLVDSLGIDLIHARSRAPAWSAWAAARRTGRPFVTTFHNAYGDGNGWRRRYNSVMARGARVIAISQFVAAHAAAVYGIAPERLRVIQRGVDVRRFDPQRVGAERIIRLARRWRLPDDRPIVMLPGRITRWKGQLDLVAALARLPDVTLHCLIVGSDEGRGGYRRELERAVGAAGQAERVQIVEDCDDMPAAFMLADLVVSASNRPEGFGRVIAEAQAMGRPVVATDHGGAREIVVPGKTGWLVPPGDTAALAAAIAAGLGLAPPERERLAARATAHARAQFNTERMCAATLAVYTEILFPEAAEAVEA